MPYRYGGYGGGYNPLMAQQAEENPFFNPYSESPDYWGGIGGMLGNLWKQKQLQEQQAYERSMEERKMKVAERVTPERTSAIMEKAQMLIQSGMAPMEAFRTAAMGEARAKEKTPGQLEEEAYRRTRGTKRAEAEFPGPEDTEKKKEKLYTRQNALIKQAADGINKILEGTTGTTGYKTTLNKLSEWGANYTDPRVAAADKGTEKTLAVNTKRYRELTRRVSVLEAGLERLAELQDKLARQETLTPDEEADVRTILTRPESFMSPKTAASASAKATIMPPAAPQAARATGGAPPRPGTSPGEIATNKRTGQKFIWNGQSWQPTR